MESAILHNIRCLSFSVVYKCRRIPSYVLIYTLTSLLSKVDREYRSFLILITYYILIFYERWKVVYSPLIPMAITFGPFHGQSEDPSYLLFFRSFGILWSHSWGEECRVPTWAEPCRVLCWRQDHPSVGQGYGQRSPKGRLALHPE